MHVRVRPCVRPPDVAPVAKRKKTRIPKTGNARAKMRFGSGLFYSALRACIELVCCDDLDDIIARQREVGFAVGLLAAYSSLRARPVS